MLLMRLGSKEGFQEPMTIRNLMYLADFFQGSNDLPHDGSLLWSIENFLDGDWRRIPSVDYAFVTLHRDKDSICVKHRQKLLDEIIDTVTYIGFEVG
jgi:hypothetical protein